MVEAFTLNHSNIILNDSSLQSRRIFFCVFYTNRGESEVSAKHESRPRGGAASLAFASVRLKYARKPILQARIIQPFLLPFFASHVMYYIIFEKTLYM